ncbi:putative sugar translocase [Streptomyces bingchenggensis BCW-1]|uniref:Putative sugar translocase n=1 Tax=Streptomyces bingchenggensis (strain BCW-1) TaxID=749414 RepID=D7C7Y3_STRBB|nr:putative sugar translocase [Streptomyces bingchenggensis BCW-1]
MLGQVVRFGLVGVVNTATYYGMYLLFLRWLPYLVAHVAAFALSTVGSFLLNCWFTYRTRPTWRKFLLFPLTTAANFVITTGGVYVLVDLLHTGDRAAPLMAAAVAVPITFVLSRTIMLGPTSGGSAELPVGEEPRVYEIRVYGCADSGEAIALQDPIARLLCPEEWHDGPCDVPWGFTLDGDRRADGDEATVLVLGVHTSGARAAEVADQVRAAIGERGPVELGEGDPDRFETLVEQYRIESGARGV